MDKETIKKTLDAQNLRRGLLFRTVSYVAILILFFVLAVVFLRENYRVLIMGKILWLVTFTLCGAAGIFLYAKEYLNLLRKAPDLATAKGYLREAHKKSRRYYFTVDVDLGQRVATGETGAYFSEYSDRVNVHDYLHKKVDVAYDAETGRVLVFPPDAR